MSKELKLQVSLFLVLGVAWSFIHCGGSHGSTSTPEPAPTTPVLTMPSSVNAGATGLTASVPSQAGCTYAWTIMGGTITAGASGTQVTFTAGTSGSVQLGCVVTNAVGVSSGQGTATSTIQVATLATPAAVTLSTTVLDAATAMPIATSGLTLTIYTQTGTAALAGPMPNTGGGVFTYVPTVPLPATFRLVAQSSGYNPASQLVTINASDVKGDGSGLVATRLSLTSTASTLVAPAASATGTTSSTGTTTQAITSTTASTTDVVGAARVTIPASTVVTDAKGAPLTGTVTLVATYSNNQSASSLASFPSGSQVSLNGAPVTLISGSGVSCSAMDSSGNQAASFSPPVQINLAIPAGTPNPSRNFQPVQAGDTIPIWYFGADGILTALLDGSGNPVIATLGTAVGSGSTAYFQASFPTSHFCFFNAGWPLAATQAQDTVLTIQGAAGNALSGTVALTSGGWGVSFSLPGGMPDPSTITISGAPAGQAGTITLGLAGNQASYPLTGDIAQTLTVAAQVASGNLSTCTVTVQAGNAAGVLSPVPSATVVAISADGSSQVQGATDTRGTVVLQGLEVGTLYSLTVSLGGAAQVSTFTAARGGLTVPVTLNAVAPTITTQPAGLGVTMGQSATFAVYATGVGPLTYQWSENGVAIPGAVSANYTTPSTQATDNGAAFTVTVSNAVGSVTSEAASLTVNPVLAPTITRFSANPTLISAGQAAILTGTFANGTGVITPGNLTAFSGVPLAVIPSGNTTYTLTVTNGAGVAATLTAAITVLAVPTTPAISAPALVTAGTMGLTASVQVQAGCTYLWSIMGGTPTAGTTTSQLTFTAGNSGSVVLTCVVTNAAGAASAQGIATSTIVPPPVTPVITTPQYVTAGMAGLTAAVAVQTGCTYVWTILGGTLTSSATSNQITFTAGTADTVVLGCAAVNAAGVASTPGDFTITVQPAPPLVPATLIATVVDAATGLPIANPGLSLTVYAGQSATLVAGPLANTSSGTFSYVPSATPPVTYRLVASAPGYLTSSQFVTLNTSDTRTDGSGMVAAVLKMIMVAAPPASVVSATAPATVSATGATLMATTAATPAATGVPGNASVTIPAGTVATNASGTPLSGLLTLGITYENNSSTGPLASFPGGFTTYWTPTGAASSTPLTLISGGGCSVTLTDASGNQAATFSSSVTLTMSIPAGTYNPLTAQVVKASDSVPIWCSGGNGSLSPLTNVMGMSVVGVLGALDASHAFYPVIFQTGQAGFFEPGWVVAPGQTQDTQVTIKGAGGNALSGLAVLTAGGWSQAAGLNGGDPDPATVTLSNTPMGLPGTLTLHLGGGLMGTYPFVGGTPLFLDLTNGVESLALTSATVTVNAVDSKTGGTSPYASVPVVAVAIDGSSLLQGITNTSGSVTLYGLRVAMAYKVLVAPQNAAAQSIDLTASSMTTANLLNFNFAN